jgi:prepilin-type N-terminal cleavage/methylation domain-containing protein
MKPSPEQSDLARQHRERRLGGQGFTLIEILIGITLLVVGILGVATMFGTGYNTVGEGGRMTMAVTAARQVLEDMRTLPFDRLSDLNNFTTGNSGSVPPADAALDPGRTIAIGIARKWRYALAGDTGTGWNFTTAEKAKWRSLGVGTATFGATGLVQVADVNNPLTLRRITVTVSIPGGRWTVQLATLVSR